MHDTPKKMKDVGNLDDICPHCSKRLTKWPQRKTKCPFCGKYILVRTRPTDRQRVLVTEKQAEEIEAQWNEIHSVPPPRIDKKKGFDDEKKILSKKYGGQPSDHDVIWSLLNKEIVEHSRAQHWGLYRNTLFDMGELLRNESKWSEALNRYFEVCYLDLNGSTNYGDVSDIKPYLEGTDWGKHVKPFDADHGELYGGVLVIVKHLLKSLEMNLTETREQFVSVAEKLERTLKSPLAAKTAWSSLENALSDK